MLAATAPLAPTVWAAQIDSESTAPLDDPVLRFALDYDGDGVDEIITSKLEALTLDAEAELVFERQLVDEPSLEAQDIRLADMDGDGTDDLVTLQFVNSSVGASVAEVGLFFDRGGPLFEYQGTGIPWTEGSRLVLADVDSDGDVDVLVYPSFEGDPIFTADVSGPIQLVENAGGGVLLPATPVSPAAEIVRAAEPVDIDQDGDLDFVAFRDQSTEIVLLRNTGQGYAVETLVPALAQYFDLEIADLDGDGATDIACLRTSPGGAPEGFIDVYFGSAAGSFGAPQNVLFALPDASFDLGLGDPDGDGDLDLVLATQAFALGTHQVATLFNDGQRGFSSPRFSSSAFGLTGGAAQLDDFNGDGFDDLFYGLLASFDSASITRLGAGSGAGAPGFGDGAVHREAMEAPEATVGDLDGDGMNDLLVPGTGSLAWARGSADGSGFEPVDLIDISGEALFMANLDDDSASEVVLVRQGVDQLFVIDVRAGGAVGSEIELGQGGPEIDPSTAQAVDVDGDGDLDLLTVRTDENDLVWFENQGSMQLSAAAPLGLGVSGLFFRFDTGDFNGDGQVDILLKNLVTFPFVDQYSWRQGLGGGAFGPLTFVGVGGEVTTVIDVNGDGANDLLWRSAPAGQISWTPGGPTGLVTGDGISLIPATFEEDPLGLADFDGDGLRDLLVVGSGTQVIGHRALSASQDFSAVGVELAADALPNPFIPSRVQLADVGSDGDLDLLVGVRDMPLSWFRNDAAGSAGSSFCGPAVENSAGTPARIVAVGSSEIQGNSLRLRGVDLPQSTFGFFIVSQTQVPATPVIASAGRICLGGSVGRYVGPGEVQFSGATGTFELDIDLSAIPQPNGFVAASPGQTWSFQAWHRDTLAGAATSNLTDGVQISVQ